MALRESLQDYEEVARPSLCGVAVVCENVKGGKPVDDMLRAAPLGWDPLLRSHATVDSGECVGIRDMVVGRWPLPPTYKLIIIWIAIMISC
jgi:hypothetical protein